MSEPRSSLQRFEAFHAENPHVYDHLLLLARDEYHKGARKIGMRMLWEVLRWQTGAHLRTDDPSSSFRLNDHYPPFYARKMMREHPELAGLFEIRGTDREAEELHQAHVDEVLQSSAPSMPNPAWDSGLLFDLDAAPAGAYGDAA